MADNRKPFLSFASDIDDTAIEAMARSKGVPALTRPDATPARQPAAQVQPPATTAADVSPAVHPELESGSTPRSRMAYVKACLPDYALLELKTRAARERVSVNHLLLKALNAAGIEMKAEDMNEDGRRLRGSRAHQFAGSQR